jgi:hypothetical protein
MNTEAPVVEAPVVEVPTNLQPAVPAAPAKPANVAITTEEKLTLREIENEFLKVKIDIDQLTPKLQGAQKKFVATVDALVLKYKIDKTKMQFDGAALEFRSL